MYPYQYQFVTDDPARNQYEKETFWFYDGLHYPEPLYPFDTIWDEAWFLALSQFNNRIFQVPPVRGVDHRMINGYVYISPVPVKDGAEIGSRVPNFMERAGYYYKNWDALEAKWKVKMEATIKELEDLKISPLPDLEDISVVTDALGESKGYHLIKNYDDLINLGIKCWQYHFEFLNLGYAAYVFFMDFTQKLFPSIPLQRITQMISGIDVIMYKPDDELKELAKKAIALGVDQAVAGNRDWVAVKLAVEKLPKGARNGWPPSRRRATRGSTFPPAPAGSTPTAAGTIRSTFRSPASRPTSASSTPASASTARRNRCAPSATASPPSTAS
jgi:pyruvate,water dikinase